MSLSSGKNEKLYFGQVGRVQFKQANVETKEIEGDIIIK
jgi:hypothetical protein